MREHAALLKVLTDENIRVDQSNPFLSMSK